MQLKQRPHILFRLLKFLLIMMALTAVLFFLSRLKPPPQNWNFVKRTGEMILVTRPCPQCYYTVMGQPMGIEYDLARAFADQFHLRLALRVENSRPALFKALEDGLGTFAAAGLTGEPDDRLAWSAAYHTVKNRIIVNKGLHGVSKAKDLADREVLVIEGSNQHRLLLLLQKQGIHVRIKAIKGGMVEDLIQEVASDKSRITLALEHLAQMAARYHPDIRIKAALGKPVPLRWAVWAGSVGLKNKMDAFFKAARKEGLTKQIIRRYCAKSEILRHVDPMKKKPDPIIAFIRKAAGKNGLDWKLIAAQIYQESGFNPRAQSAFGALGLMQMLPSTGKSLGKPDLLDPKQSIYAGAAHLKNLYDLYDRAKDPDRLFISLAAYNAGQGHMLDARNLARRMDLNPDKWTSIQKTLPLLRLPQYHSRAKYGFCRGDLAVDYVKRILAFYHVLLTREKAARQKG